MASKFLKLWTLTMYQQQETSRETLLVRLLRVTRCLRIKALFKLCGSEFHLRYLINFGNIYTEWICEISW
jgi:hypothetical protein